MSNTLNLGGGKWAAKEGSLLAYNSENGNFKPLPFTFDRSTSATRVNKEGLIEVVSNNEPRIDFLNDSKGALLLEPSRSNKVSTSNDFNGSDWNISNLTATANQIISPDGTLNASKLEMTGNGSLRNQSEASFNDGYAYSIFVKKGNSRYVTIRSAFFTQSFNCGFDLDTLTSEANGKIEDYGNDWYRLSITKDISGDVDRSGFFYVYLPNSLGSQTSVSGNYIYAYGGQIEDGSYATSYIPTQGSIGTRVAELCVNGGLNAPVFNNNTAVWFIDLARFGYDIGIDTAALTLRNSSGVEQIRFHFDYPSKAVRFRDAKNGFATIGGNIVTETNIRKKVALKIDGTTLRVFADGSQIGSDYTRPTAFDIDYIELEDSSFKLFDTRFYNTALTDQELINLTKI